MKKIFTLLPLFLTSILIVGNVNATNYYFASSGSDSYTAAQAQNAATPWKTLGKLNSFFSSLQAGDSVLFKRGDTFYGSIVPSKSGTSALPIVLAAYGSGSNPVISGGTVLSSWTSSGGGIYETSLTTTPKVVTINGQQYGPGRYPDNTWLTIDATNGSNITSTGLAGQSNLVGASVVIRKNRTVIDKGAITAFSGNTITCPISYSAINQGYGFFITNKLSTLTTYGEWFYDNAAQKLKVYFGSGGTSDVTASTTATTVSISSRAYINFINLDFSHASSDLVDLEDINNIVFNNCGFRFSGGTMVIAGGNTNKNLSILNCTITNIDNDAMHLYGGNNDGLKVQNNTFTNIGSILGEGGNGFGAYSGIIMEGNACINALVANNKFQNVGHSAIVGGATNSLVKNNLIINSCMYADDAAAIYVQEPNGTGKRITGNIIIDVGIGVEAGTGEPESNNQAKGIYCDASNAFTEIDNNTITGADDGIYIDDSHDINIHHNTIYNNGQGIAVDFLGNHDIANLTIKNNTCVNPDAGSHLLSLQRQNSGGTPIGSWGDVDYNYWCRPLNDTKVIYSWSGSGNAADYTIPLWWVVYGYDIHSKGSPISVPNASMIRFEYNATTSPKTVSLASNYMAIDGTVYSGSVTLAPFTSIVLLQTSASANQPPVANAGTDKTITLPVNSITQTGSGTDPNGNSTIASYQWTKISGPATYNIVSPTQAQTVINNLVQGVYQFELKVTDNQGASDTDTMTVTVNPAAVNQPPTANAGTNQNITLPVTLFTLTGSGTDPDGTIAAYQWTKVSGPLSVTINLPNQPTTTGIALLSGTYEFELKVTDNQGAVGRDTVILTVNAAAPNQAPTANAGADRNITLPTNSITQTGSGTDPDGTIASYQWTKIAGPATFTIVSPTQAQTVINNLVQGVYQFELKVTDNNGATGKDTVTVTVNAAPANQPPTANAGPDRNITLPTNSITQTGSGTDADGTIASYQWTKIAGPATFTIVSPTQAQTVINNLVQGVYQFELKVTDNNGATGKDTVTVTVNAAPANQPPTANAGPDRNITLPTNSITQTGSGTDADGTIVSYQWTKITGPATFNIVSPTQAQTVINNLVQGVYQFELKVTDNNGATAADTMIVTVNPAVAVPNQLPTANAGADRNITLPTNSITQTGTGTDPDGIIASYQWTKIAGPATFTIVSPTQAQTVINNLVQGVYQFELKVTDNNGGSDTDTMTLTVNAAPVNQLPTANAGADRNITLPTNSITQTGSGTDPDGTIASYQWTKIAGPATFTIVSPAQAQTVINNLVQGVYQFELKVTDNNGGTDTDTMVVTVNPAVAVPNQLPTANAGPDRNITLPTNSITQTGSGTDPDGTIASYQWTKIAGPATFTIVSPTQAQTVINNLVQGVYQFELKVTDNQGGFSTDIIIITVNAAAVVVNQSPVANAGADSTIILPDNDVILEGTATDPDNNISSYSWRKITGPSQYRMAAVIQGQAIVSNLVEGVYVFELKATDAMGATGTDTVRVTVLPQPAEAFTAKLYPNPATTNLNIEIAAVKEIAKTSIEIFDMSGKMITHKEAGRNQQRILLSIDVNKYPSGTYFVKIKTDNNLPKSLTFVKQ